LKHGVKNAQIWLKIGKKGQIFQFTPFLCQKACFYQLFGYFAFNVVFEFCAVLKCFVNDFAFSAYQFWSDVFDYDFAVMLSVYERFRITQFLLLGFLFGFASVRLKNGDNALWIDSAASTLCFAASLTEA
jgi:hypothetical protein